MTTIGSPNILVSGRYRRLSELGRGGMAVVEAAHDTSLDRQVALKRLLDGSDGRHVALFEREFHTLASLRHPNIVHAYDYGRDAEGPYYTMELLDGSDLSAQAPLPWQEVCAVLRDVAAALSLLHSRRLVHRDIQPRNVWRTPQHETKVIDFGAVAPFGRASHVVGTAPALAPEVLYAQMLGERSDLYALGALGYYLLCGTHAYPAKAIAQLPEVWKTAVLPPSRWVQNLSRQDLPPVPQELDDLLLALLSQEPSRRPADAAEVLDRVCQIAGIGAGDSAPLGQAYLRSTAFCGREKEIRRFDAAFERARTGVGACYLIGGESGQGRSRLMAELALRGGFRGATVVHVSASSDVTAGALMESCAMALLAVTPELARRSAGELASTLAHLSEELAEALQVSQAELAVMPETPGEARARVQAALHRWFLQVAEASPQPIVLTVDDVQRADGPSLLWLAELARSVASAKLILLLGDLTGQTGQPSGLVALRAQAKRMRLTELEESELLEVLRSVVGSVAYLERLTSRLHQRYKGHVGACLQALEALQRQNAVTYRDGTWSLPREISDAELPDPDVSGLLGRLSSMSKRTRGAATRLSLVSGRILVQHCPDITDLRGAELYDTLAELLAAGVLRQVSGGYEFAQQELRPALGELLDDGERKQVYSRLAEAMLSLVDAAPLVRLQAAVYGMRGEASAHAAVARYGGVASRAAMEIAFNRIDDVGAAAPQLEVCLAYFHEAGCEPHELIAPLAPLARGGFYVDPKLGEKYAGEALEVMQQALRFGLASKLRPLLGKKLSLYVALIVAAIGFRKRKSNPLVPSMRQTLQLMMSASAASTGMFAAMQNPDKVAWCAGTLEPFSALPRSNAANIIYRFNAALAMVTTDSPRATLDAGKELVQVLESPEPIEKLETHRRTFLAGALYLCGGRMCFKDDGEALSVADRLDGLGLELYRPVAEQLRMVYYAFQADFARSHTHAQRVERYAQAQNSTWQVECWKPLALACAYYRARDAAGVKRQVLQLERSVRSAPWMQYFLDMVMGSYLLVSGRPREALEPLQRACEIAPRSRSNWTWAMGVQAEAYNALGEHTRAREVCEAALELMDPGDEEFCAFSLPALIEYARALAELGELEKATQHIDGLLERLGVEGGAVTMGDLHRARRDLAQLAEDTDAVERHALAMKQWYEKTDAPGLHRFCDEKAPADGVASAQEALVHRLEHGNLGDSSELYSFVLSKLSDVVGSARGYLFSREESSLRQISALDGGLAPTALVQFAEERLRQHEQLDQQEEEEDTEFVEVGAVEPGSAPTESLEWEGVRYAWYPLQTVRQGRPVLVAGMLLETSDLFSSALPAELTMMVASHLFDLASGNGIAANSNAGLETDAIHSIGPGPTG